MILATKARYLKEAFQCIGPTSLRSLWIVVCAALVLGSLGFAQEASEVSAPTTKQLDFFETKIRPVLVEKCYECHSGAASILQGSLSLETRDGILRGGDSGPVAIPGKPQESLLIQVLRHQEPTMPPDGKLSDSIVVDFEHWVQDGLVDPRVALADDSTQAKKASVDPELARKHWAFQPIGEISIPANNVWEMSTVQHARPIDAFVQAKLRERGWEADVQADPLVLLRRASLGLTGLPPTLQEIESYLADPADLRYERLIDRLLASQEYGVRWGRHWLDLVRYANSNGADENHDMPNAWRYRDWVVDSLNEDLSFDEFVTHQIAGDLLPAPDDELARNRLITATGFWVLGPKMLAEQDKEKMKIDIVDEQIDTFSRTMLGVTLSCARCHDHKFDPLAQRDYYAMAGIFMSTRTMADQAFVSQWMERPLVTKSRENQRAEHQKKIDQGVESQRMSTKRIHEQLVAEGKLEKLPEDPFARLKDGPYSEEIKKEFDAANKQIEDLRKGMPEFDKAMAVEEQQAVELPIHIRGNHLKPTEEKIPRGLPVTLTRALELESIEPNHSGRMQLARWLTHRSNPLFARVMVNRVWMWHFGQPLVGSPSNFGLKGEAPTHPELLDELARRWMEQGWSLKWLHREILLSAAYQRSSRSGLYESQDPENRLLWRQNRHRLEMEPIRDSLLACAERLDRRVWGGVQSMDSAKRSIYLNINRAALNDTFAIFDYVDPASHIEQRATTTVPSQSLFFLNNEIVWKSSEKLGQEISKSSQDNNQAIVVAFRQVLGREPTGLELERSNAFVIQAMEIWSSQIKAPEGTSSDSHRESMRAKALGSVVHSLFALREFIWVE
ncbi:MAG: PSD1 and planctomycete cytochrome C domain-containing protein [Planctomycetota bacterium]